MSDKTYSILTNLSLNSEEFKQGVAKVKANTADLIKGVDGATGSFAELKKAMQVLKSQSFAGKTPQEIQAIKTQIGNLNEQMKDQKAEIEGITGDFGKLTAGAMQGFVAVLQIGTAVASAFGADEEATKKYTAVMTQLIGVSQAVATIEGLIGDRVLQSLAIRIKSIASCVHETTMKVANTVATNANTQAEAARATMQGKASLVTKTAAAVQWLWNAALAANPVGLVVVAVAALVAGITALIVVMSKKHKQEQEEKKLNEQKLEKLNTEADLINHKTNLMKAQGIEGEAILKNELLELQANKKKNEEEIKQAQLINNKKKREEELKKLKKEGIEIDQQIEVKQVEIQTAVKKAADEKAKSAENNKKDLKEEKTAYELLTSSIGEMEDKIKNILASGGIVTPEMLINLDNAKKKVKEIDDQIATMQMNMRMNMEMSNSKPVAMSTKTQNIKSTTTTELNFNLEKAAIKELTVFYKDQYKQRKLDLNLALKQNLISQKEYNEAIQQIESDKNSASIDAMQQTYNIAQGIFKENTIAYKASAIAEATISTYLAANNALSSAPPPFNFILMGATIAAGLVNVGKIAGAFATGGIVPQINGVSPIGDHHLARVNPQEMILTTGQQSNLFNLINNGGQQAGYNNVKFEIEGTKLVGVLSNQNKKTQLTR